jgi:hypothetical protein
LGDETIIRWVVDGTEKYTVELQQATFLVQFVLDFAAGGDLNDGVDNFR